MANSSLLALFLVLPWNPDFPAPGPALADFHQSPWFEEQVYEQWLEPGVRLIINATRRIDPEKSTRLVIFATPNGNTIEQTLGCRTAPGLDWHFDIQHVAAQVRRLRELVPDENIVLACVEAEGLAWPAWRARTPESAARVRAVVDVIRARTPGKNIRITITGHSGGGSFLTGYLNGSDAIPAEVERIAYLDSNYSYSDSEKHGDKFLAWLQSDNARRLIVIAYDDRNITVDGKLVVSSTGGTFRASGRMLDRFKNDIELKETKFGPFVEHTGLGGRLHFLVHPNPENKIFHTVLVGEMNGVLQALAEGTQQADAWGKFGGPRAYTKWVQPAPAIPPRPGDAIGGAAFMNRIAPLPFAEREEAIAQEILRGNIPEFLRRFAKVSLNSADSAGKAHTATCEVMPDYLCVGSDADFVRVPMTPMTAQRIADAFGCSLPTRKIADEVYKQSAVKLEPKPMTQARESVGTFVEHHGIIESQRAGRELGLLVAGIKKDVILTNRLGERPHRVGIYGWHKLDGTPIQPVNVNHVDTYVDYSHGVRLVKRNLIVDGKPRDIRQTEHAADLCGLVSDEGPLVRVSY